VKTVYAVSSGSYSDYSVHCIFERSADAVAYLAAQGVEMEPDNDESGGYSEKRTDSWNGYWIEPFQMWGEGEIPVA
jgi:hypothetical protein